MTFKGAALVEGEDTPNISVTEAAEEGSRTSARVVALVAAVTVVRENAVEGAEGEGASFGSESRMECLRPRLEFMERTLPGALEVPDADIEDASWV